MRQYMASSNEWRRKFRKRRRRSASQVPIAKHSAGRPIGLGSLKFRRGGSRGTKHSRYLQVVRGHYFMLVDFT